MRCVEVKIPEKSDPITASSPAPLACVMTDLRILIVASWLTPHNQPSPDDRAALWLREAAPNLLFTFVGRLPLVRGQQRFPHRDDRIFTVGAQSFADALKVFELFIVQRAEQTLHFDV